MSVTQIKTNIFSLKIQLFKVPRTYLYDKKEFCY